MYSRASLIYLHLLPFATLSGAYWLSPSCQDAKNKVKLTTAIDYAFSLAAQAAQTIGNPQNQQETNLQEWIFGDVNTKDAFHTKIGSDNSRRDVIAEYLNRIGKLPKTESGSKDELMIYCDTGRLTKDGNDRIDNDNINPWLDAPYRHKDEGQLDCVSTGNTMAYTHTFGNPDPPNIIQLCPWYLDKMDVDTVKTIGVRWRNLRRSLSNLKNKPSKPDMDVASHLASTILHEMTHTDASGVSTDSGGQEESYGWENIRKLSTRPSGGSGNADSLAYFALGIDLIRQGKTITENGAIQ